MTQFWLITGLVSIVNNITCIKLVWCDENEMDRENIYNFIRFMCILSLSCAIFGIGLGFLNLSEIGSCVQRGSDNNAEWEVFSSKLFFRQLCLVL
jgi:hypothetical protein